MHPEIQLAVVSAFAGFLLKTFLGFGICWAISKVVVSPSRRFLIWFTFLFSSGCYWLWLIFSFIPHAGSEFSPPIQTIVSSTAIARWQMQPSWAYPLLVAERALGSLYLLALAYFIVVRVRKHMQLRWVLRFAYPASSHIESVFRSMATHYGAKKVRLLVLSGIYSPATFGCIRTVVLLPPLCLEQDERELTDIFRHELQHVSRHDFFFNNVAGFCKKLLFFHPALWYAMCRMELESELACDLAVVGDSPGRRASYAECLVRFARLHAAQDPTPWNLDFAGSSIQLKVRVRSILKETAKLPLWLLGLRTSMGMLLVAFFLCIVPSLTVALSYARGVAQPIAPSFFRTQASVRPRKKSFIASKERRSATRPAKLSELSSFAPVSVHESQDSSKPTPKMTQVANTLDSGEPVPALQQRDSGGAETAPRPARATVVLIANPAGVNAGDSRAEKERSIASAVISGATEAARFAGSHGKDVH